MIGKAIKYLKSFVRIIILKIRFGNKFRFKFKNIKSLYIGKGIRIKINKDNILYIGENVYIDDYCRIECLGGDIHIGKNTFFNTNNTIVCLKKIYIGGNCLFGPNVGIYDHDHRYDIPNLPIISQGYNKDDVNIGDNVWIGSNCTVTRGVSIKNKIVIAANSVVTKDLIVSGIYGGIPSKFIKSI